MLGCLVIGFSVCSTSRAAPCKFTLRKVEGVARTVHDHIFFAQGKTGRRTPLFRSINAANAHLIFTHQYNPDQPDLLGAKAVGIHDTFLGHRVYFFASGKDNESNNVHHRDVLAALLHHNHVMMRMWHEPMMDMLALQTDRVDGKGLKPDTFLTMIDFVGEFLSLVGALPGTVQARAANRQIAEDELARYWLGRVQGYQLTAQRTQDGLRVIRFDVDSSITKLQKAYDLPLDTDSQTKLLHVAIQNVSRKLRGFSVDSVLGHPER